MHEGARTFLSACLAHNAEGGQECPRSLDGFLRTRRGSDPRRDTRLPPPLADIRPLPTLARPLAPSDTAKWRLPPSHLHPTSVPPPFHLRSTSVRKAEVLPRYNGGRTEVERRYPPGGMAATDSPAGERRGEPARGQPGSFAPATRCRPARGRLARLDNPDRLSGQDARGPASEGNVRIADATATVKGRRGYGAEVRWESEGANPQADKEPAQVSGPGALLGLACGAGYSQRVRTLVRPAPTRVALS